MASSNDADIIHADETAESELQEYAIPDAYLNWIEAEGVKRIVDYTFADLNEVELSPWDRKGGSGAIITIPFDALPNDAHLVEIRPGGKSEPEHHMYELQVYVLSGLGATSIWLDDKRKSTFEWRAGSLFSIPLNAWYQNFNASGSEPARYVAVTNAPPIMRLFKDNDFVFNCDYGFSSRYAGAEDYFNGSGRQFKRRVWESNFIPNAPDLPLFAWDGRGAGGINAMLEMAGNSMKAHISEFPIGTYKKAHRHGPGAHLILLSGDAGYSLLWQKEDMSDLRKSDWKKGAMVVIPDEGTYHQHFNSGKRRARYLALRAGNHGLGAPFASNPPGGDVSMKEGGRQVEYGDEARRIHEIFEAELAKNGAICRMKAFIPYCTGEIGPTSARET